MNFGAVQRLARELARQTRGKKVNRGEPDGQSGTRSASIPAPPNQQKATSHDITWNYRNLSFLLSSSSSRYYKPYTPPKSAHQCKVLPTSDQQQQQQEGVCHTVALPFTLNSILRQNKNYGNSNISPCTNILIFKSPLKETKILQDIILVYNILGVCLSGPPPWVVCWGLYSVCVIWGRDYLVVVSIHPSHHPSIQVPHPGRRR